MGVWKLTNRRSARISSRWNETFAEWAAGRASCVRPRFTDAARPAAKRLKWSAVPKRSPQEPNRPCAVLQAQRPSGGPRLIFRTRSAVRVERRPLLPEILKSGGRSNPSTIPGRSTSSNGPIGAKVGKRNVPLSDPGNTDHESAEPASKPVRPGEQPAQTTGPRSVRSRSPGRKRTAAAPADGPGHPGQAAPAASTPVKVKRPLAQCNRIRSLSPGRKRSAAAPAEGRIVYVERLVELGRAAPEQPGRAADSEQPGFPAALVAIDNHGVQRNGDRFPRFLLGGRARFGGRFRMRGSHVDLDPAGSHQWSCPPRRQARALGIVKPA